MRTGAAIFFRDFFYSIIVIVLIITTNLFGFEAPHVPGEIIIKFAPEVNIKNFFKNKSIASLGLTLKREIKLSYQSLNVLSVSDKNTLQSVLAVLKKDREVVYAEPNFIYSIAKTPNDPSFGKLWGIKNTGRNEPEGNTGVAGADINLLPAWEITRGSQAVRLAIVDTGVDYTHPDLIGNVDSEHGFNFVNNTKDAMDDNGHGTHCAGIIGAIHDNKIGVTGVMAEVVIIPLKFLDSAGQGELEAALKAIDYATEMNVDLISNSWSGGGSSQALFEAIKRASDKGIIFTAAAGNNRSNNDQLPNYPASYDLPNIVSVAAFTAQNEFAQFSSYGKKSVHIVAPGQNILSTVRNGKYEIMSGTSMATPYVSGALGLLLAKEGRLPHELMRERLMMTAVPVVALRGKSQTASRLDAYNLLTDTRPERYFPENDKWRTVTLSKAFESPHPYLERSSLKATYHFPGVKYIRVKILKFDIEAGYDYLRTAQGASNTVEKISGTGENYISEFIEGEDLELNFVSDFSLNKWGFKITEVEVQ